MTAPFSLSLSLYLSISVEYHVTPMNTNVNNERPESTFKMPLRTKSPKKIKQDNAQESTKPLQRTKSIESMDSESECIVASPNLEEVLNYYNTWNHLIVGKLISKLSFFYMLITSISYNSFHHTTSESTYDTLPSSAANQGDNTVSVAQGGTATPMWTFF